MIELIIAECKKIYRKKALWGLLLLLAAADIYKVHQMHGQEMTQIDGYQEVYAKIRGKITEEKLRFVIDYYKECEEKINAGYSTEYNQDRYTGYDFGDYNLFPFFTKNFNMLLNIIRKWKNYVNGGNGKSRYASGTIHLIKEMPIKNCF